MLYEIEFLTDGGPVDVAIALSGEMVPTSFREMVEALGSDPRYRPGLALLIDISGLTPYDVTDDESGALTAVLSRDWDFPPRAVAIIAPTDETFRAARTYRANLGGSMSKRHVVRSHAEALAWLSAS